MPVIYLLLISHMHLSLSGIPITIIPKDQFILSVYIPNLKKTRVYLIVKAKDHFFIGTDNGIFNLILNGEPDKVIRFDSRDITDELEIFARAASAILSGKKPAGTGYSCKSIRGKAAFKGNN